MAPGTQHSAIGMISLSLLAVAGLALVHVVIPGLRFLDVIPRSRLLSVAGGMSVAYVFLRILPELDRAQGRVGYEVEQALHLPRDPIYLVALLGLTVFYGLDRLTERSRRENRLRSGTDAAGEGVFWLQILSYAVVNLLIGYLVFQRPDLGLQSGVLFFLAMGLYLMVNDYGLLVQHRSSFRRTGRWILVAALLIGWAVGRVSPVPDLVLSIALAFIGGGVVFNVMREELPRERESRFAAFALGAAVYSALLLSF